MRVTYYALKPLRVGTEVREPGDLVPEASEWNFLSGYISDGKIAPVLVASLPEETQMMLLEWEEEQAAAKAPAPAPEATKDTTTKAAPKGKADPKEKVA